MKKICSRVKTEYGEVLIYAYFKEERLYGIEITLREANGVTVCRYARLFRRRIMARWFIRVLKKGRVYPQHLKDIAENFDYNML